MKDDLKIPKAMREAVDERDKGHCRMCGKYLGSRRAIHHIWFGGDEQGMGGRRDHSLENLISLCWLPYDNDCHQKAHSRKDHWQPFLAYITKTKANVTALQLVRRQNRWRNP